MQTSTETHAANTTGGHSEKIFLRKPVRQNPQTATMETNSSGSVMARSSAAPSSPGNSFILTEASRGNPFFNDSGSAWNSRLWILFEPGSTGGTSDCSACKKPLPSRPATGFLICIRYSFCGSPFQLPV